MEKFINSSLLKQGFVMHLGHNGKSSPAHRTPGIMSVMAGAEEEKEQEEDLTEYVPEIMGGQDTLVIAHSNGVFHHHIQWCAFPGSSPITSNCSDMVCFQTVSSTPRLHSHLQCLTIFTWMPWNARLPD